MNKHNVQVISVKTEVLIYDGIDCLRFLPNLFWISCKTQVGTKTGSGPVNDAMSYFNIACLAAFQDFLQMVW